MSTIIIKIQLATILHLFILLCKARIYRCSPRTQTLAYRPRFERCRGGGGEVPIAFHRTCSFHWAHFKCRILLIPLISLCPASNDDFDGAIFQDSGRVVSSNQLDAVHRGGRSGLHSLFFIKSLVQIWFIKYENVVAGGYRGMCPQ